MMNAHGWRGVHALDAIAHGDGPRTFADLVTQEFQWSRSSGDDPAAVYAQACWSLAAATEIPVPVLAVLVSAFFIFSWR